MFRHIGPWLIFSYQGQIINHITVYSTLPWSNIPHSCMLDLTMVDYTTFRYIRPCLFFLSRWNKIPCYVRYIQPHQDRIYHIPLYLTLTDFSLPRSNIYHMVYWILTNFFLPRSNNESYSSIFDVTMVEYTIFRYIRPWVVFLTKVQ